METEKPISSNDRRRIDGELELIPYFPNEDTALQWYQDPDVCKQCDNIDVLYDIDRLRALYGFLSTHGACYYICYKGELVGDCTLRDNGEIAIVVSKPFQNRHIGRRCVGDMLKLAREKGFGEVRANIYSFNTQSRRMFASLGFIQTAEEWYSYRFEEANETD